MCPLCSSFPDLCGQANTNVLSICCLPGTVQKVYPNESCDGTLPSMREVVMGVVWGGLRQKYLCIVSDWGVVVVD